MGRIKIEFEIEIPNGEFTDEELEEYLRFIYGDNGSMALINPLSEEGEPSPIFGTFEWEYI